MKHTRMHFNATKYSLTKALEPMMNDLFALAIDAYQNHRINYLEGWQIAFAFQDQNHFEISLLSKNDPNVHFIRQYDWDNAIKHKADLKQKDLDFIKAIHTIHNAIKRQFSKKIDEHVLNVIHLYEHQLEIILKKVRWSMWKNGLNTAELILNRLKRSKWFSVNWIHSANGKIAQIDFETKKILPVVFNRSPDFYRQEKNPLAKGSLKFDYSKKGFYLITTNLSDFPDLIPNQAYMKDPDCELSDLDLICLSGQLHQAYGKVQIELTKILRQNV